MSTQGIAGHGKPAICNDHQVPGAAVNCGGQGVGEVHISVDVFDVLLELCLMQAAVQDGDGVATVNQTVHHKWPSRSCSANDQRCCHVSAFGASFACSGHRMATTARSLA